MTARIRIILANHSALRSWNTQTAKSAQTMQGGLQTTLTSNTLQTMKKRGAVKSAGGKWMLPKTRAKRASA